MSKVVSIKKPGTSAAGQEEGKAAERPAYSGGLSAEELTRPGGKLLAMLVARANQLGVKLNEMCHQELGCTYGYFHQLRNGARPTAKISDEFATRCALFLGVPRITVLMCSGRVSVEDYFDRRKMAAGEIRRCMQFVVDDPEFGVDMSPEVLDLPLATQFALVTMYEKATGRKLMQGTLTMDSLVKQLTDLDEITAKLKAEAKAPASSEEPVEV